MSNTSATQSEIAKQLASSPGVSVTALFSSHLPKVKRNFTVGECKTESEVVMRPMNAQAITDYRDSLARFSTRENGGDTQYIFEPNTGQADIALLMGTIVGMTIFFLQPLNDECTEFAEQQFPYPKGAKEREKFFNEITPELRTILVGHCKEANGLHPLSQE